MGRISCFVGLFCFMSFCAGCSDPATSEKATQSIPAAAEIVSASPTDVPPAIRMDLDEAVPSRPVAKPAPTEDPRPCVKPATETEAREGEWPEPPCAETDARVGETSLRLNERPSADPVTPVAEAAEEGPVSAQDAPAPARTDAEKNCLPDDLLAELIGSYEKELEKKPDSGETRDRLCALYLLAGKPEKAFRLVPKERMKTLSAGHNLIAAWALFESGLTREGFEVIDEMARKIKSQSPLSVRKALFVEAEYSYEKRQYFGNYREVPGARFGPDQKVAVYMEVDHFAVARSDGNYVVGVKMDMDVVNADGESVPWDNPLPDGVSQTETLKSPIRDFCPILILKFPRGLKAGDYRLKVTLRDTNDKGKAPVETFLPFSFSGN